MYFIILLYIKMEQRTEYDRMMKEKFNPIREQYNSPPFPGERTSSDEQLQKKWCPNCNNKPVQPHRHGYGVGPVHRRARINNMTVEGYAPLSGFRTQFDEELQKKWCGSCNK